MTRFCFLLFFLAPFLFCAQRAIDPDKIRQFNVTINQEDQIVKTQILKDPKKIHIDNEATYMWYTSNQLVETKGGYDGKLLHGYYKAFFFNNQLREMGQMRYGLKHRKWRYWYSNGMLREIITWKNGRKCGAYAIYNDQGMLMARGRFKNDLLSGRFQTFDLNGKVTETKYYRNGTEQAPRASKKKNKSEQPELTKEEKELLKKQKAEEKALKKQQRSEEKARKKSEPAPEQTAPPQDSTQKPNFLKRLFKKKDKEPKVENKPTGASA